MQQSPKNLRAIVTMFQLEYRVNRYICHAISRAAISLAQITFEIKTLAFS